VVRDVFGDWKAARLEHERSREILFIAEIAEWQVRESSAMEKVGLRDQGLDVEPYSLMRISLVPRKPMDS